MKKLYTLLAFVAVSTSVNAQTNLIPNAGFETWTAGVPDSWFIPASTTIAQNTTVFHGGASSIGLTAPATSNKTISPTTDTPVSLTATYVFSGWYLDNDVNAKFKNWNQFRTATADTGANAMQAAAYSTDSAAWQFFTAESVPNATATVARPGLRVYPESTTATGGVILLDDIMFYDKATLAVVDAKEFDNQVKMQTVISDNLTIQMPSRATVNIYSMDGKLISSNRVNSNEAINTQSLASGVYLVTIQNDFAKTSRKIMKN